MMGLKLAARFQSPLWVIRPAAVVNTALYQLTAEGVKIRVLENWVGRLLNWILFGSDDPPGVVRKDKPVLYGSVPYYLVAYRIRWPLFLTGLPATVTDQWVKLRKGGKSLNRSLKRRQALIGRSAHQRRKAILYHKHQAQKFVYRTGKDFNQRFKQRRKTFVRRRKTFIRSFARVYRPFEAAGRLVWKYGYKPAKLFGQRTKKFSYRRRKALSRYALYGGKSFLSASLNRRGFAGKLHERAGNFFVGISRRIEPAPLAGKTVAASMPVASQSILPTGVNGPLQPATIADPGVLPVRAAPDLAATSIPDQPRAVGPEGDPIARPAAPEPDAPIVTVCPPEPVAGAEPGEVPEPPASGRPERPDLAVDIVPNDAPDMTDGAEPDEAPIHAKAATSIRMASAEAFVEVPNRPIIPTTYLKRMWIDQVPPLQIPPERLPALQAQLENAFGIGPNDRIVTLHMRDARYKAGREVHDVKVGARNDSSRNVGFANYQRAIDHMRSLGIAVVRIGAASMAPIDYPGVIDLATSPHRSDMLEFYCVARSEFFIGCESGAVVFAWVCGKPVVYLNATEPLSASFPFHGRDIFTVKRVHDRRDNRMLDPLDMLSSEYLDNARRPERFEYLDNSPEDVLDAVADMLEMVEHGLAPETPEQRAFRLRAIGVGVRKRLSNSVVRKWGPHHGFLGRGRLAPRFARKYIGPNLATSDRFVAPEPRQTASVDPHSRLARHEANGVAAE